MSNPPKSKWFSTPNAQRKRKEITLTLSPEARTTLDELSEAQNLPRSIVVENLILKEADALPPHGRRSRRVPPKDP